MENKENLNEVQEQSKPTYAQLEKQVYNLAEKCLGLYEQLQQATMFNTFKRLDYCFKVIEYKESFASDFVENCKKDIVDIMSPVPENKEV